ncbi:MAG: peptidoglycan-binding protein, partial [Pseudomonadota bacterium]|nr:peptidoglycan-binding protein [Pseudomonadota bacterium]
MVNLSSKNNQRTDIWPGFVDALAALLMVIIFLVLIFVIAQFFLSNALTGSNEALKRLQGQVSELSELLNMERQANTILKDDISALSDNLASSFAVREELKKQIILLEADVKNSEIKKKQLENEKTELLSNIDAKRNLINEKDKKISKLSANLDRLEALRTKLDTQKTNLTERLFNSEKLLESEKNISKRSRSRLALVNRQIIALRTQLAEIAILLDSSEQTAKRQRVRIANLGKRLNAALANKVQELSRYRSEFFGRLRDVLGSQPGVQIVGDRFVFQSEVLFGKGSEQLETDGRVQIQQLADTLKQITKKIPKHIDWILRVDGHTDPLPINTTKFPSNWELSTARAISVVKFLTKQGIPPINLAA